MKRKNSDNYIILGEPEKAEEVKLHLINKYTVEDFDIKTVFADEIPVLKILEETEFLPVFSQKKILHVKNCEKINAADCKIVRTYFENPSPDICLILSGKDIKEPLADYVDIESEEDLTKSGLFPRIFRMGTKDDGRKLTGMFREHLKNNERDFTPVINAAVIYLRNVIKKQKKIDRQLLNKYTELHRLDFNLKTGRIHPGHELEIFLYYLFS